MELIKISELKLKVMLSEEDMRCYDLDFNRLEHDCSATKAAFRKILAYAKNETGFDVKDNKLFVQIYPAGCGGCEMFVTRLPEQNEESVHLVNAVYSFCSLDELLTLCSKLAYIGFGDTSELYADEKRYYLAVSEDYSQNNNTYSVNERGRSVPRYPLLGEYGKRLCADKAVPYIHEHCRRLIAHDAVRTLSELS